MSGAYDFVVDQGATFSRVLTWTVDGEPVDLTGWAARMQVRKSYGAATAVLTLTESTGITLDAFGGITLRVEADAMAEVRAGEYVYDLELDSGGEVTRLIAGTFTVSPEVTR